VVDLLRNGCKGIMITPLMLEPICNDLILPFDVNDSVAVNTYISNKFKVDILDSIKTFNGIEMRRVTRFYANEVVKSNFDEFLRNNVSDRFNLTFEANQQKHEINTGIRTYFQNWKAIT
jgi:hypothetical protein